MHDFMHLFSYANRAKNIKNNARINEDPKDAMLREFQKEIEELKKRLAGMFVLQSSLFSVILPIHVQPVRMKLAVGKRVKKRKMVMILKRN